MKSWKILTGLGLILGAILIVLDAIGIMAPLISTIGGVSVFEMILALVLLALIIERLIRGRISSIFFYLGFLFMIFEENIAYVCKLENANIINNWLVLLIALMLTVGFESLFSSFKRKRRFRSSVEYSKNGAESRLGSSTIYVDCNTFTPDFIENDLGSCTVFFENIESYTGDKTLHIENHLGSMEINVPKEWRVVINIENTLGGASYPDEEENGDNDKKILYINGENNLGSISIEYV